MIVFENIDLFRDIELSCALLLPQVGHKLHGYKFDSTSNTFIEYPSDIVDYVITDDYKLLLGIGHYKLSGKSKTIVSAGRLSINENGKISYLDNDSGHYSPDKEHLIRIYGIFKSLDMVENCDVKYLNRDSQFEPVLIEGLIP